MADANAVKWMLALVEQEPRGRQPVDSDRIAGGRLAVARTEEKAAACAV